MINGFYINLDGRRDRFDYFEKVKSDNSFLTNIQRFSAISNSNGALGCTMSHYNALKLAYETYKGGECIAIFEDDFFILDKNAFNDFVSDFSSIKNNDDWSVITFTRRAGTYYGKYDDKFNYIKETQTMSGYIIKTTFIETLMKQLEIGITNMENGLSIHNNICDQIWKPLQHANNFIYYNRVFAGQLPSYSNLEKRVVDYNRYFINERSNVDFIFLIVSNSDESKGWYNNIPDNTLYIRVVGDESISESYQFNNAKCTLYMKMENSINVLQDNLLSVIEAVNQRFDYKYIFKLNYNETLVNAKSFGNLLNVLNQKTYAFVGDSQDNNQTDTFVTGKGFFLSNNTVTEILERKMNINKEVSSYLDISYKNSTIYFDANSILKTY